VYEEKEGRKEGRKREAYVVAAVHPFSGVAGVDGEGEGEK
jgi:hypothetical protein